MLQLSQKEKQLLQDQKSHEEVCIQKYQQNAQKAIDPKLKQLFENYAAQEQQHLNTVGSIINGQVPNMAQGQQSQQSQQPSAQGVSQVQAPEAFAPAQSDVMMCNDMLMTEKYVSGAYDTAIFEFADANVRQALNHIQKEEQQHGEGIFNYMNSHGMYSIK